MKDKIDYFVKKHNGNLVKDQELEFDNKFGGKSLICFYYENNILLSNAFHDYPNSSGKFRIRMNMLELEDHLNKYIK